MSQRRKLTPNQARSFTRLGVRAERCFLADALSNVKGSLFIRSLFECSLTLGEYLRIVDPPKQVPPRKPRLRLSKKKERTRKQHVQKRRTVQEIINLFPKRDRASDLQTEHDPRIWNEYTSKLYERYNRCAQQILTDGTWENLGVKKVLYKRIKDIEPHEVDYILAQWEWQELSHEAYLRCLFKLEAIGRYHRIYRIMRTIIRDSVSSLLSAVDSGNVTCKALKITDVLFSDDEPWSSLTPIERNVLYKWATGCHLSGYRSDHSVLQGAIRVLREKTQQQRSF